MPKCPPYYRPHAPLPRVRRPDDRPTAATRGYDRQWAKLRRLHFARHPVCQHGGCTQAGEIVDHIKPVRDYPELRLDPTNLQTLCRSHHAIKTDRETKERKA